MYMTGGEGGRGVGLCIFRDTQENKCQAKSDPKNKSIRITDIKNKSFVQLCDSSKLSDIHFLRKFEELRDELKTRVLLSSFISHHCLLNLNMLIEI